MLEFPEKLGSCYGAPIATTVVQLRMREFSLGREKRTLGFYRCVLREGEGSPEKGAALTFCRRA